MQIKLETSCTINGNSSGQQIDTLGIAFTGGDFNSVYEYNFDWQYEEESANKKNWIEQDSESFFRDTLSKEQAIIYANDLDLYDADLKQYQTLFDDVRAGDYNPESVNVVAEKALSDELEKYRDQSSDDLYNDWLNGDYRGNFDGVMPATNKHFRDEGITLDYDRKSDTITIEISDDTKRYLFDEGRIESKSKKAIVKWVQNEINSTARYNYEKEQKERAARRIENDKTREYQNKRKANALESKRQSLLELSK